MEERGKHENIGVDDRGHNIEKGWSDRLCGSRRSESPETDRTGVGGGARIEESSARLVISKDIDFLSSGDGRERPAFESKEDDRIDWIEKFVGGRRKRRGLYAEDKRDGRIEERWAKDEILEEVTVVEEEEVEADKVEDEEDE